MRKKLIGISLLGLLSVGVLSEVVTQPAFARTLNYEKDKKTGHLRLVEKSEDGDDSDGGAAASAVAQKALKIAQEMADGKSIPYSMDYRSQSVNGPDGATTWMDCSYFISQVLVKAGVKAQGLDGWGFNTTAFLTNSDFGPYNGKMFKVIKESEAKPGDLVVWDQQIDSSGNIRGGSLVGGGAAHIGMIDSKGSGRNAKVIECNGGGGRVNNSSMDAVIRENTVAEIETSGGFEYTVYLRYIGD